MPPPYSAGSVFLQVVPSFAGVQEEIGRRARSYGRAFGEEFDKGFAEATKDGVGEALDEGMKRAGQKAGAAGQRSGRDYAKGFGREAGKSTEQEIGRALDRTGRTSERAGAQAGRKYGGKFAESIKKALAGAQREIDAIKIDADTDPALAAIGQIRAAMAALRDAKIGVDLDAADAVASISALEALLDIIQQNAESIQVRVDAAQAMTQLATVRTMVESLNETVEVDLQVDRKMGTFEKSLKAKVAAALDDLPPVDLQVDDSDVNQKIAAIRAELFRLGDAQINVDMSTDEALIRLRTLMSELTELDSQSADVGVRIDAAAAYRELATVFGMVEALEAQDVDIDVDVDSARARGALRDVGNESRRAGGNGQDAANAFRAFNIAILGAVTLGPALIPVLGAIAGGLMALGPAAAVGIAGIGVLALGFSGISDAVGALGDVEKDAAKDTAAAAKTMRSAYNSVRDARTALARAQQSADDAAEDAGRRVDDALRGQVRAEERYREAVEKSIDAQRELVDARQESADQLEDLTLRARGAALSEEEAQLRLAQAQAEYITTMQDGSATYEEREEASLAARRAQLSYDQAVKDNLDLQEEQAKATETGIEGTETYQQALERVAGANDAVADAQTGVEDAARDVAEAQEAAARSQRDSAQSIADATQRLVDAQISYQEALYDTSVIGSSANQKLQESFANLGPEGQEFARFIHGLRDDVLELRTVAQAGLLPGVQEGIQSFLDGSGDELLTFVGGMSQAFGDLAARAGEALGNPEWQAFFDLMNVYGPIFVEQWGAIFGNIIEGIRNVLTALFPFTEELGGGLVDITQKWADWTAGFSDPNSGFQGFIQWVRDNAPAVLEFFSNLFGALRNIVVALAPFGAIVLGVLDAILGVIEEMDPDVLGSVAIAILAIVTAFQLFNGVIALVAGVMNILAFGAIAAVVFGVVLLGAALVILWTQSETFRSIVLAVWDAIKAGVAFVVDWFQTSVVPILQEVWDGIAAGASWLWENILKPIFEVWQVAWGVLWDFVKDAWERVGQPAFELIWTIAQELWQIVEPILTLIGIGFKLLWDLVKTYWEFIGKPIFDAFIAIVKFLWENVIGPILGFVVDRWEWMFGIIESAWNTVGKPVFDLLQAVVEGLVGVFQGSFDGIKGIWDALVAVFKAPIKFLVETVLNAGLIGGINSIAGIFTDDDTWIDPIKLPEGFAVGGQIPGSAPHKRADNVLIRATPGEFMQQVDAVDYYGVDFMQALNERRIPREMLLPGFAYGGMIDPLWDAVRKHDPRARLTSGYRPGDPGLHGRKMAIDVAGAMPYPNATGMRQMLEMNHWLAAAFPNLSELIHTAPGAINLKNGDPHRYSQATQDDHRDHNHVGATSLDALTGGTGVDGGDSWYETAWDFISSPFDTLQKIITDAAGDLGKTQIGEMLLNIPTEFARNIIDPMLDFVNGIVDAAGNVISSIGNGISNAGDFLNPFNDGDDNKGRLIEKPDTAAVRGIVQDVAAQRGWDTGAQWSALSTLISKESSWNPGADNPTSTAYGLFQFLDSTWRGTGYARTSDPRTQALAGMQYIASRYGNPLAALNFHKANNWYADGGLVGEGGEHADGVVNASLYDEGGYLPPGLTMVLNATGKPEPVLTAAELEQIREGSLGGNSDGDRPYIGSLTLPMVAANPHEAADQIMHEVKVAANGGRYAPAPTP